MPRRGKRIRLAKGIFKDASGIAIILPSTDEKGRFRQEEQRRPADSNLAKLKAWREDEIKKRKDRKNAGLLPSGTFAADALTYLAAVTALPTYRQRCVDIGYWVAIFGHRRRESLQSHEIRAVRDRWLTVGPKRVQRAPAPGQKAVWVDIAAPLGPQTVALRLRALENLWTVLDGKKAKNPVRDVPEPEEATARPKGLPQRVIAQLLKVFPPGHPMTARLHVMAHVGLAQSELQRVEAQDINLAGRSVWVPGRKKGRGARGGAVPLSPAGVAAFRDLLKLDACGSFNTSSLWHFFQRHARPAGFVGLTPYVLRHSLFTGIYLASGDEGAVKTIARHAAASTTRHYTGAAANPRAVAAMAAHTAAGKRQARAGRARAVPGFAPAQAHPGARQRRKPHEKTQ